MTLFKSYTFTWPEKPCGSGKWQTGVFKVALLAIGAAGVKSGKAIEDI